MDKILQQLFIYVIFLIMLVPVVVEIFIAKKKIAKNSKMIFVPVFWWGVGVGLLAGCLAPFLAMTVCYVDSEIKGCMFALFYSPMISPVVAIVASIPVWGISKFILIKQK